MTLVHKLSRPQGSKLRKYLGLYVPLSIFLVFALFPIYWMIITSMRTFYEAFQFPPSFFPSRLDFSNFTDVIQDPGIRRYFWNSVIVSTVTAFGSVIVGGYAAYSFSRFRYRGRRPLMYLILVSQMVPQALLLITLYLLFSRLGLLQSYMALVLSFASFTLPLCVWLLKSYFDAIPTEIVDAAKVDGARTLAIIHRIILPLALPGLVATGLFAFVRAWNDFIYALTLAGPDQRTLPPGLVFTYLGEMQNNWPSMMSASLLVSVPVVVAFMLLQRYLIEGLTAGAVKG